MARFGAGDYENYGGQGGGGFFGIAGDKETKQVRFLYNTVDDIEGMSVHKVEVNGKDRYVNCLREYNQPVEDCPFCREHMTPQARLFIPLYNIDEDTNQIWDRGKTMFPILTSQCTRYSKKGNIVNNIFEIERNGKPKDKKTTYQIYQVDEDDTELEDLPEVPKILGGLVLDKTAEDMEYYLENGEFPPADDDDEDEVEEEEAPARRRESRSSGKAANGREESNRDNRRRTPARSGKRKDEEF